VNPGLLRTVGVRVSRCLRVDGYLPLDTIGHPTTPISAGTRGPDVAAGTFGLVDEGVHGDWLRFR